MENPWPAHGVLVDVAAADGGGRLGERGAGDRGARFLDYLILNNMTSFYSTEAGEYAVLNPYLLMGDFASGAMGSSLLAGYESLNPGPFMQIDEGTPGAQLFGRAEPERAEMARQGEGRADGRRNAAHQRKRPGRMGDGRRRVPHVPPDADAPNPPGFLQTAQPVVK